MELLQQCVFHSRLKIEKNYSKGLFKYHWLVINGLNVFMIEGNNSFITKEFYGEQILLTTALKFRSRIQVNGEV